MPKIEGFRIQNFRTLKDVTLGRIKDTPDEIPLTPMTAVIGKNGVGKSTIFDAFGFLADCLKHGVEEACDLKGRGGFNRLRSQGQKGEMLFEICYKQDENSSPITYQIAIGLDKTNRPHVFAEILYQHFEEATKKLPIAFLILINGSGIAWKGDNQGAQIIENTDKFAFSELVKKLVLKDPSTLDADTEIVELSDKRKLGITTLGALKQHPHISAFREFIEGWYLSYFTPNAARSLPHAGPQKHLNSTGDNLGNVVQFMEREHPDKFQEILDRIAEKIPGIDKIKTESTPDGRLLLQFNDKGFSDPFYAQQISDGTLKVFAYLLLLEDPTPPSFICIEEPENGLYHKLLETLADEFRSHATGLDGSSQVFITTHQPYFVDALKPEEVWILEKGKDGFSTVRRASADPVVNNMVEEGLPLGGLWYSNYLDAE